MRRAPHVSEAEQDAIHHLTEGRKHLHRSYGELLDFHTDFNRSLEHFFEAVDLLRDGGQMAAARTLEQQLPHVPGNDRQSATLCETFRSEALVPLSDCEEMIRQELSSVER